MPHCGELAASVNPASIDGVCRVDAFDQVGGVSRLCASEVEIRHLQIMPEVVMD